ncbi:MAG: preprotein translocase subunit SecE [Clostridia bacterium]|nr:preprotein translocase subunit SecE [Clostridia bacterium]
MADKETKNVSPANESKSKKSDKPGFFARIGAWFKGLKSEFKKITWASRKATFKNFGIVLAIVIVSAVVIGAIDIGLTSLLDFLMKAI